MKTLFLLMVFGVSFGAFSQEMEYSYDNAGNRISRVVLVQRPKGEVEKSLAVSDTIHDSNGNFNFALFPNPTTGNFQIEADPEFMLLTDKKIQIYDISGRFVKELEFSETTKTIDIGDQSTGSYVVKLIASGGFRKEWRLIKE